MSSQDETPEETTDKAASGNYGYAEAVEEGLDKEAAGSDEESPSPS